MAKNGLGTRLVVVVMVDTFGLVALVALYCNGLASNSWYVLVG